MIYAHWLSRVRFAPQAGKYKVYIVDEVHMLSASAFNAFLKTLEEPPSLCHFYFSDYRETIKYYQPS